MATCIPTVRQAYGGRLRLVYSGGVEKKHLRLLVDPVELGGLVGDDIAILEPEGNLLLGVLDGVRAVADVAADVDGVVATDGAGGGGKGVGGTEKDCEMCIGMRLFG